MPAPASVDWSKLSPRSREIVRVVVLRLGAGYETAEVAEVAEVAAMIDQHRDELKAPRKAPPNGRPIGTHWIAQRLRELRAEIEESGAAKF